MGHGVLCRVRLAENCRWVGFVVSQVSESRSFDFAQDGLWGSLCCGEFALIRNTAGWGSWFPTLATTKSRKDGARSFVVWFSCVQKQLQKISRNDGARSFVVWFSDANCKNNRALAFGIKARMFEGCAMARSQYAAAVVGLMMAGSMGLHAADCAA